MSEKTGIPNHLIHSTSPYLLQHAYNPVNWVEWNSVSLARAKQEDKPILVSIGYSSCHWCHVMERECFEKDEIAAVMNEYFVCIKVDREERPDVDQVYMEAVQAMGGHGGWPLNVFLTPDQKPFYGGTYFPPDRWVSLLRQIRATFLEKRNDLEQNAEQLTSHLSINDSGRFRSGADTNGFTKDDVTPLYSILSERFDTEWGGLEKAPKFVMPTVWLLLLRIYAITGNPDALEMVRFTLVKMQHGGLYDQLGGGFSRYSVDGRWFAPHFEKMLYDNAQLLTLYSEAYAYTKDPSFRKIVYETTQWLKQEMRHPDGGFYSALDADSEGVEGKFYTWTWRELGEALGDAAPAAAEFFHCTPEGNWEHGRNILIDTSAGEIPEAIRAAKQKMLQHRSARVRPGLDDKILAGWNAMTVTGLTAAYAAFGDPEFLFLAEKGMLFIETRLVENGKIYRSYKNKHSPAEGFLEDYALVIEAYRSLYQVTFNELYLSRAEGWCRYVIDHFSDTADGYFYFTGDEAEKLIARKKEIFDNVIPGSNSIMAGNLYKMGILLDKPQWKSTAEKMILPLKEILQKEPGYLSNWGILMTAMTQGIAEVIISGPDAEAKRKEFSAWPAPFAMLLGASGTSGLALLEGKISGDGHTRIFVCYNKTCQLPVEEAADALKLLK